MNIRRFNNLIITMAIFLVSALWGSPVILAQESTPTIGFFGAARCHGGSCHLLNTGTHKILLDCGSFMDSHRIPFNRELPFPADSVDLVTLSHAHLDHCGRLPVLFRSGYSGEVLCAKPTGKLTDIMLHVQQRIHAGEQGNRNYSNNDVAATVSNMTELDYHEVYSFRGETEISFLPAEHILGSAMTQIQFGPNNQQKTLVFTGDFGNNTNGILKPKATPTHADYLVIEATYGGKIRNNGAQELEAFYQMLKDAAYDNGVVIIPSFVLARTQKVLGYIFQGMASGKVPDFLNVYVDSPSASRITKIYSQNTDHLLEQFQGSSMGTWSPFSFRSLFLYRSFTKIQHPAVIIAPSADASSGKIVTHLKKYISEPTTRICFVSSYHPGGSLSEQIYKGADRIEIQGKTYPQRAKVFQFGSFSGHGDQAQLMDWLKNFQSIRRVFIVHGDLENMELLRDKIQKTFGWSVTIPELNRTYELETGLSVLKPTFPTDQIHGKKHSSVQIEGNAPDHRPHGTRQVPYTHKRHDRLIL